MTTTDQQCSHWRTMRPRPEAVTTFVRQWYAECGCWPSQAWVRIIFNIRFIEARDMLREARAVLEREA